MTDTQSKGAPAGLLLRIPLLTEIASGDWVSRSEEVWVPVTRLIQALA